MTRIGSTSVLVLAIAAMAFPGSAIADYTSLDAVVAGGSETTAVVSPDRDVTRLTSLDAVVAGGSDTAPVVSPDRDISRLTSLDAVVAGESDTAPVVSPVRNSDGFDWLDGAIGALVAAGLTLTTLAAARTVTRHRRATAESRA